jgi:16S rRNA (guanine527-N7)-methyltransferase
MQPVGRLRSLRARSPMEFEEVDSAGLLLNSLLQRAGTSSLDVEQTKQFATYLSLFVRWNSRTNLSSVREPERILERHFVESITCARALPEGISTVLDFGSGGGLPGIPIVLCRPELHVTLAESQGKKAAFLHEAVRVLGISAEVFAGRAETIGRKFDCVVLRAVDKMPDAARAAAELVVPGGWLGLMTTQSDLARLVQFAGAGFSWGRRHLLPGSADRLFTLGQRKN